MSWQGLSRDNVEALIEPEISRQIIQGITTSSKALSVMTKLPNMTSDVKSMPVLAALPSAQWVDERVENGRKSVTNMAWDKKYIKAAELAVIVPIKENLLADASYDIWGQIRPRVIEAFNIRIDEAIFLGINKPESWRAGLLPTIKSVGAEVVPTSGQTLYSVINDAMVKVEESGYSVNRFIGGADMAGKFRMMLDTTGQPVSGTEIGSIKREVINNGAWDKTKSQMIVGDFSQAVYSIRQDISVKLLTESVIQDEEGNIMYNLPQQDMVALRFTMRLGWEIPNPISALAPDESVRFPFASVTPSVAPSYRTVTFTAKKGDAAYEGAKIECGGIVKTTNTAGKAVFSVVDGEYQYTAKVGTKKVDSGNVVVDGNESVDVVIPE